MMLQQGTQGLSLTHRFMCVKVATWKTMNANFSLTIECIASTQRNIDQTDYRVKSCTPFPEMYLI